MALDLIDLGDIGAPDGGKEGGTKINAMFTELYTISLNSSGTVDGTDQLFTGHVGIGGGAAVGTDAVLTISETLQDDAANKVAQDFHVVFSGSQTIGKGLVAFNGWAVYEATPVVEIGSVTGLVFFSVHDSAADLNNVIGAVIKAGTAFAAGEVKTELTALVLENSINTTSGTIAYSTGLSVANFGSTNVTNAYGLYMTKQSLATNNYGISLAGDNLGSDISFGASQDVRQHFNGSQLEFEGSGIAHTATPVTNDGYVEIAINGVTHKFMTGS